jgi:ABC-2 type transport system ATP-binding protein
MKNAAPPIELEHASKRFGTLEALAGLDFSMRRGELVALLGPNGAGKSTAIALMLGLQAPSGGSVRLFGEPPRNIAARRRIGVMMQEVGLNPTLRARELVDLVSSYYPKPLPLSTSIAAAGIEALAERPYGKLSGGQKRQVQFAMSICGQPELIFLDEPTVGLDVEAREKMWRTLRGLIRDGASIVLTTHYLEEAEALASRVAVLVRGRLVADGSVGEMRALVARKRISCISKISADEIARWPGVESAALEGEQLTLVVTDADTVVRRLVLSDESLKDLEVRRAGLAEAFAELTRESAR